MYQVRYIGTGQVAYEARYQGRLCIRSGTLEQARLHMKPGIKAGCVSGQVHWNRPGCI